MIVSIGPAVRWLFNKAILGKRDLSWFWPDSGRLGWDYIVIGLMAGIFFLAGIILFAYGIVPGESAVWVVFPYLLFSGMLIWMTTKCCNKRAPKPSPKIPHEQLQQLLHGRYTFAVLSLLLLFSALPMATFFKIGTDREMLLAMKYNLITLGHKLRRAPDLDFSQIQAMGNCTKNGSPEACLQRGIHVNVLANTELVVSCDRPEDKDPHPSILDKFHRFIRENSLSQLSNHVSIETLGLLRKQPPDKPDKTFYWEDVSSSSTSLKFQAPPEKSDSETPPNWVTLKLSPLQDSWFSIKGFPDKRHVVSLLVFIAGVLVIVLVPLFIVRRIFPILPEPSRNPLNGDYEAIWQRQTPSAQVTLYNLAKDGFVHAENPDLVTLSQDRLIKVQPAPGWLDDDFEKHVLIAGKRDGLDTKQQKSQSQWQVWKVPLVVVFIVLALGLLLTQEEFSNVVVLMLSALPVLLPTLSELIGSPQTGGKASADG